LTRACSSPISNERDARHARAEERLLDATPQGLAASPITLAEVLVGPAREGRLEHARAAVRDLDVREVPLGADAASRLARLRAETALKLPDCCVILAAQDASACAILTFDDRLQQAAARLGVA
jgi:predicted nucleic acid-binding protein